MCAAAPAWAVRGRELLLCQVLKQRRQGAVEDRRHIAIGDLMAQERLGEAELLVRLGARRELHLVALQRKRGDSSGTGRGGGNGRRGQEEGSTRCASAQFSLGRRTGQLKDGPLSGLAP